MVHDRKGIRRPHSNGLHFMEERRYATLFIDPSGGHSDFNRWRRLDDSWWSVTSSP